MKIKFLIFLLAALAAQTFSIAVLAESPFWDSDVSTANMLNGVDTFNNNVYVSDVETTFGQDFTLYIEGQTHGKYSRQQIGQFNVAIDYSKRRLVVYKRVSGMTKVIAMVVVAPATLSQIQELSIEKDSSQTEKKIAKEDFKKTISNSLAKNDDQKKNWGDNIIPGMSFYSNRQSAYHPYQPTGTLERTVGAMINPNGKSSIFFEAARADDSLLPVFQTQSATFGLLSKISSHITTKVQLTKIQSPLNTIPEDTVIMGTISIHD